MPLKDYFSFRVARVGKEEDYQKGPYLFAEFPHGVFPFGFTLSATALRDIFPDADDRKHLPYIEGAIASILFRIPLIRQLSGWFGAR